MNIKEVLKSVRRFTDLGLANKYSNMTIKPSVIILGDDQRYWVCNIREASILKKAGYEVA